jgi:hypothetical protein
MTSALTPATITRLEKAAVDNGFDQELPRQGDWLGFASTRAPLRIWLTAVKDALFLAAVSQQNVVRALGDHGSAFASPLPPGACGAHGVADMPALHRLVRRAFQLSKTLPDELLHVFEKKTAALPRTTEAERLVVQRVGQDVFRAGLLEYWEGRCAVTGLSVRELLRASHIKPWADCESDAERLDVFNGLLLAPHLDAAFDRGFVTVGDDGAVVVSALLAGEDRRVLGLDVPLRARALAEGHRSYLSWHRERVFKAAAGRAF